MAELEGTELVKSVAERVMGWPELGGGETYPCYFAPSEVVPVIHICYSLHGESRLWNPLADMKIAWEIVNAMRAKGWRYRIWGDSKDRPEEFQCSCAFARDEPTIFMCRYGATEGEAIARAALAAVKEARG